MSNDDWKPSQRTFQAKAKPPSKLARAAAEIHARLAMVLHEAREAGHAHYPTAPHAPLVEVARHAAEMYVASKDSQIAFLQGYVEARRQHERIHGTPREE